MTWFGALFVLYTALGAVMTVGLIGQDRKPVEPGLAVVVIIMSALLIWGAVTIGTN